MPAQELAMRLRRGVGGCAQEALERELLSVRSADARPVLEDAIERCRKAAAVGPERGCDELALVTACLLGPQPARVTVPRPRLRVIAGGLADRQV